MRTLGNIIWHIPFMGFLFALLYALGGLLFCITVIGIPVGLGLLQFSLFLLSPFSKAMVSREDLELLTGQKQGEAMHAFSLIVRILYFPFGLLAAIGALGTIVTEFMLVIGIPSGIVWAKSLSTIFNPVNKVCVPRAVAMEIERRKNEGTLNRYTSGNTPSTSNHTTNSSGAVQNKYMERVMQKSDEELKELIQQKDDFNPELIKAAEKVLLARVTGTEVVMDEPASQTVPYVYKDNLYFKNIKGDILVLIGILFTLSIKFFNTSSVNVIYPVLGIISILLIFIGLLKNKEEHKNKANIGIISILIGSFIYIIIYIVNIRYNYFVFTVPYSLRIDINKELQTYDCITNSLYLLSSVFTLLGAFLWKYLYNKQMNTIGLCLICIGTIVSHNIMHIYILDIYGSHTFVKLWIIMGVIISILGWYIFIGLDKPISNEINQVKL